MSLNKADQQELVSKLLSGDQDAFGIFYDEYGQIVTKHAKMWFHKITATTHQMYGFDDIENEIWEHVLHRLPAFNSMKSTIVTFMFMVCNQAGDRINNHWNRKMRSPEDGKEDYSLDYEFGEDEDLKMIDIIIDPTQYIEDKVVSDIELFEYIYFLRDFIETLTIKDQRIYIHMVQGLTLEESGRIIGLTRERIRQIRNKIIDRVIYRKRYLKTKQFSRADNFSIMILSEKDDDEVAEQTQCQLATVKICRKILEMASVYANHTSWEANEVND